MLEQAKFVKGFRCFQAGDCFNFRPYTLLVGGGKTFNVEKE